MKKRRTKHSHETSHSHREESIHFRLCHCCHFLNESTADIVTCTRCGKYLTLDLAGEGRSQAVNFEEREPEYDSEEDEVEDNRGTNATGRPKSLFGLSVLF